MGWAIALAAVSTAIGGYGLIESGEARSAQASYQAQVARNNAITAQQNARYASEAGAVDQTAESLKGAQRVARAKVTQAASGVDVNSGSAVAVRAGEAENARLDTATVANNTLLKVYGYNQQATNFSSQAGLDDAEASQALTGGALGAAGTLLGGASSIVGKWGGSGGGDDNSDLPSLSSTPQSTPWVK